MVLIEFSAAVRAFAFVFKKWEDVHGLSESPVLECVLLMFGREPPSPPSWQKRSEPGWRPTPWRCTLRRRCWSADTARCGPGRGGNDCFGGAVCWGRWNPQPGGDRVGVSWARWRHCAPSVRGLHNVDRERRAGCPCVFLRLRSSGLRFQRVPVIHFSFWICSLSTPSRGGGRGCFFKRPCHLLNL